MRSRQVQRTLTTPGRLWVGRLGGDAETPYDPDTAPIRLIKRVPGGGTPGTRQRTLAGIKLRRTLLDEDPARPVSKSVVFRGQAIPASGRPWHAFMLGRSMSRPNTHTHTPLHAHTHSPDPLQGSWRARPPNRAAHDETCALSASPSSTASETSFDLQAASVPPRSNDAHETDTPSTTDAWP